MINTSAHLRALIRHVTLVRYPDSAWVFEPDDLSSLMPPREQEEAVYETQLEWLEALPENALSSVTLHHWYAVHDVLAYPAVRTSPRIALSGFNFLGPVVMDALLSMPTLTDLSMEGMFHTATSLVAKFMQLKRLSVSAWASPVPLLWIMCSIDAVCPLQRLDISLSISLAPEEVSGFLELVKPHAPKLKHFSIIGQFGTGKVSQDGYLFMDQFISHLVAVETLYCAEYTSSILSHLPPTIRTLVLVWSPETRLYQSGRPVPPAPFPCDSFCSAIARLHRHSLRKIQIVGRSLDPDDFIPLFVACEDKQIALELADLVDM